MNFASIGRNLTAPGCFTMADGYSAPFYWANGTVNTRDALRGRIASRTCSFNY